MSAKELLPAHLRNASPEEQLRYFLERKAATEKLIRSLESYANERDPGARQNAASPPGADGEEIAHSRAI